MRTLHRNKLRSATPRARCARGTAPLTAHPRTMRADGLPRRRCHFAAAAAKCEHSRSTLRPFRALCAHPRATLVAPRRFPPRAPPFAPPSRAFSARIRIETARRLFGVVLFLHICEGESSRGEPRRATPPVGGTARPCFRLFPLWFACRAPHTPTRRPKARGAQ